MSVMKVTAEENMEDKAAWPHLEDVSPDVCVFLCVCVLGAGRWDDTVIGGRSQGRNPRQFAVTGQRVKP